MKITKLATDHLRVTLGKPSRIPLTGPKTAGPDAVDLILVRLETDAGVSGLGFTYTHGPGAAAVRSLIEAELTSLVVGEDARDTDRLFARVEARFREVGFTGLAARAYAAVDVALWDVKAKAAGVPLCKLLGNVRPAAPFFVSDIAPLGRDAADVVKAAKPLLKHGAVGVRVEVGSGDVQADADRVREVVAGLGDDAAVGVAAGGRFDLFTATALAHFFEDQGIDLFEDPIPAGDASGYAKLAAMMEVPLAVGAGLDRAEDFYRVIRAGDVRTVRPDVCRLGGITPLLKVAAVAEAFHVTVSPVRLPEVGVHLACGLAVVPHADSVGWFKDVFAGGPRADGGKLVPPAEQGLGVSVNADVARFRV
jgi:L-alanine-DL-glutamate epimerase-like enolase superfamily enzyme